MLQSPRGSQRHRRWERASFDRLFGCVCERDCGFDVQSIGGAESMYTKTKPSLPSLQLLRQQLPPPFLPPAALLVQLLQFCVK